MRFRARRKGIGGDGDAEKKKSQSFVPQPPKEQQDSASPFALDKIGGLQAALLKHEQGGSGEGDWSDDD